MAFIFIPRTYSPTTIILDETVKVQLLNINRKTRSERSVKAAEHESPTLQHSETQLSLY